MSQQRCILLTTGAVMVGLFGQFRGGVAIIEWAECHTSSTGTRNKRASRTSPDLNMPYDTPFFAVHLASYKSLACIAPFPHYSVYPFASTSTTHTESESYHVHTPTTRRSRENSQRPPCPLFSVAPRLYSTPLDGVPQTG